MEDEEFQTNADFQQQTIELADLLDLDELEAAKLYNLSLTRDSHLDRPPVVTSVITFHERRQYLVECLRLCFKIASIDFETEDDNVKAATQGLISLVLERDSQRTGGAPSFWRKVLSSMEDGERSLQHVFERVQTMAITGQIQSEDFAEIMSFQRTSLIRQHESLAALACHLVTSGYVVSDDSQILLDKLKRLDRYDVMTVHYLPVLCSSITQFASNEGRCSAAEAAKMYHSITSQKDNDAWKLRSLQAAATAFWIAEYSGRFADESTSPAPGLDSNAAQDNRSARFLEALHDGAFQFLLIVCEDVKNSPWYDPLRRGITAFLTQDSPALQFEPYACEVSFQELLMEQLQNFVEAFISNMPDTLRNLRSDEDDYRRQTHGGLQSRTSEQPMHLERFYIITSFAFETFEQAADSFWTEADGNLHGFLVWASQRQSTPRVAAFCELLRAISWGKENGDYAHDFLLEEKNAAGRLRRSSPLSWHHITSELEFYSNNVRGRPMLQLSKDENQSMLVEPESDLMLECYLRLIAHLCHQSPKAREWFLSHTTFLLHEHLLLLCSSSIPSRLRGNAFSALASLLTGRTQDVWEGLWSALDAWIYGAGTNAPSLQRQNAVQSAPVASEKAILEAIATGFEEPNAFVRLLGDLVAPAADEICLNDALPFPEVLGTAYRMPGMESYVDFVLGRVFAQKSRELQDPLQLHIMRCSCLSFAVNCLSTFNEDLVVFANQSKLAIDSAMRTSSLAAYAKLHPFARTMEWFFNDSVINALFEAVDQDIREVTEAATDSPVNTGILLAIRVIDLVLSLQSAYFDVVRPMIKLQNTSRRAPVANSALASFEDAVLNNLGLIAKLGLYAGSGHQDLVIASLQLLQKLASSKKLAAPVATSDGRQLDRSRLITALERNGDSEVIARGLIEQMHPDQRLIEQGVDSSGFAIQLDILRFLNACLATVGDRPTIAHALLGFTCYAQTLDVTADSLFTSGGSLLHALIYYTTEMPDGDGTMLTPWLISAKALATGVIAKLLKSNLSSKFTREELRANDYLVVQWWSQAKIGPRTSWGGRNVEAPDFLIEDSGTAYVALLQKRSALLDHAAMELRSVSQEGLASLKSRILATLMGTANFLDGSEGPCLTLFDLIDFLDVESNEALALPESQYIDLHDLEACSADEGRYDLSTAEQLLQLRSNEIRKSTPPLDEQQSLQLEADLANILQCLSANNRRLDVRASQIAVLKSWVQLLTIILTCADFTPPEKNAFILQSLQVILPRLDQSYADDIPSATLYAHIALALLHEADISSTTTDNRTIAAETANDRFFALFRIALAGLQDSSATSALRLTCAQICTQYLRGVSKPGGSNQSQRAMALQAIKARGEPLVEVLCDEAYAGTEENRVATLLLLGALVAVGNMEREKYLVEALARLNFVGVCVVGLKDMPSELQSGENSGKHSLLIRWSHARTRLTQQDHLITLYTSILSLLLLIAQTRIGATHIINAGLFPSLRESGLLSTDPDIGLDIGLSSHGRNRGSDSTKALSTYFSLLTSIVRIVLACVIAKGAENESMLSEARGFCTEYWALIASVFKRSGGVGLMGRETVRSVGDGGDVDARVDELADVLMLLVTTCGWLEAEESRGAGGSRRGGIGMFS